MDHDITEDAMPTYLASYMVVCAIAIAVTGCGSSEFFNRTMIVDNSDHNRLQRQPPTVAIREGVMGGRLEEYSPTEAVKSTMTDLLSILGNEALNQPGRSQERRHRIEEIIRHRVSYEQMAQRALGVPWKQLSDSERQEFVSLFVQLLRDTFANKIDQYYDERMFYVFEQRQGTFAEVRTNLIGSKVDTLLDFRLGNKSGDWLVYDVVIDGASIVRNYQAQFNRIIRDDSYAGLVEKMKQRDLVVKGFEKTAPAVALSARRSVSFSVSEMSQ